MAPIRPYLFTGPTVAAADLPRLRARGVGAILSLQRPGIDLTVDAVMRMRVACEPAIAFRNVAITDYDPQAVLARLPEALAALAGFVDEGRIVYLHCTEGINRAPSVALAHLVVHEGLTVDRALADVRRAAPFARPYPAVITWLAARA